MNRLLRLQIFRILFWWSLITGSVAAGKPQLSIDPVKGDKVRCQGQNLQSLSAVGCTNLTSCEQKWHCLVHGAGCAGDEDHSRGHTCTGRNAEDCLEWDISADTSWDTPGSGIVACKSSGGVYTTDHMFLGYDDRYLLISNVSESDVFNIHMTDPNLHFIDVKNHRFGSNETVGVLCFTSSFFVDPKSLKLKAITTDGGRFDIEQGIDRRSPHALFLDSFQVTDTIAGFNCDGKWLEGNALKKRGSATAIVQFRAHGALHGGAAVVLQNLTNFYSLVKVFIWALFLLTTL